ncbi:uncharacterized protein LOC116929013 [Daphnia magna]|uniref:uncharacterized protein LOC116929013 n=1 Tax=Daphnia magna TaxID=35525 RepID=UPI001E1BB56A|nr:uncharacterized protein LOC116929013 [Daphnia magna]
MQYDGSVSSIRAVQKCLTPKDSLWISQNGSTLSGLVKSSEMSLSTESQLELETHHSSTIFCDMMSPDEWKSSLPLVFQQNGACSIANSPTSPSNSIEDLVLELENSSQDVDLGSPFAGCPDNLLFKVSSTDKYEEDELVCNMDTDANDMLYEMMETEKEIDPCTKIPLIGAELEAEEIGNRQKSSDPLSTFLQLVDKSKSGQVPAQVTHLTATREPQFGATENASISEKEKKEASLQRLTSRLANVIHCNSPDNANILQKATSTISTLRQQACDLMSTYSQLKFQNDELIQKQQQLHSEQFLGESSETLSGCPLIIEVLIPSRGAKKAFDSAPLYHHIPIEDGQIPITSGDESFSMADDILEEPYEEQYDAQTHLRLVPSKANPCKNKKLPCQLGCICSSLEAGKLPIEHCKNPSCMLESRCTQPHDPSHTSNIVFPITKERRTADIEEGKRESNLNPESISTRRRSRTTKVSELRSSGSSSKNKIPLVKMERRSRERPKKNVIFLNDPKIDPKDPKLLNDCNVCLVKLDPRALHRKPNGSFDAKLYMKCYVTLQRLQTKQDQPLFCTYDR